MGREKDKKKEWVSKRERWETEWKKERMKEKGERENK